MWSNIIIGAVVFVIIAWAAWQVFKPRSKGGGCCGGCKGCSGGPDCCSSKDDHEGH